MHFRKAKIVVALCQATARNSPPDCCIYIFESPSVNAIPIKKPPHRDGFLIGGPEEIRTPDPYNANVMRSQLRYGPRSWGNYTSAKISCQAKPEKQWLRTLRVQVFASGNIHECT